MKKQKQIISKSKLVATIISVVSAMALIAVGVLASISQFKVEIGNQLSLQFDAVQGALYATRVGDVADTSRAESRVLSTSDMGTNWLLIYDPLDQDGDGKNIDQTNLDIIQEKVDFVSDDQIAQKVKDGATSAKITYYFYYTLEDGAVASTSILLRTSTSLTPTEGVNISYAYKKVDSAALPDFTAGANRMINGDILCVLEGERVFIKAELVVDLTRGIDFSALDWSFILKFEVDNVAMDELNEGRIKVTESTIGGVYAYYTEYGSYPKTIVSDETLLANLNDLPDSAKTSKVYTSGKTSKIVFEYTLDGEKYVKFEKNDKVVMDGDPVFSDGRKVVDGTYWFKVEPIRWYLLQRFSDERVSYDVAFSSDPDRYKNIRCISENILDVSAYDLDGNTWGGSKLRAWQNSAIYGTAFSEEDKTEVVTNKTRYFEDGYETPDDYNSTTGGLVVDDYVWSMSRYEAQWTFAPYLSLIAYEVGHTDYAMANGFNYYSNIGEILGSSSQIISHTFWLRTTKPDTVPLPFVVGAGTYTYTSPQPGWGYGVCPCVTFDFSGGEDAPVSYRIKNNLTGVTLLTNISSIDKGASVNLMYTAEAGYTLPDNVSVLGATLESWNKATGELRITNVTGEVTITIVGVES